jgi:hypothetical protein
MPKEKLTLSVDKDVVEKAKKLDLNISELTELALRGFSFSARETNEDVLYESYQNLFSAMKPLLQRYDASVIIGLEEFVDPKTGEPDFYEEICLLPNGNFYAMSQEAHFTDITKISPHDFVDPMQILKNLLDALAKSREKRKETIRELEMAKRMVNAIETTLQSGKASKKAIQRKKRRVPK